MKNQKTLTRISKRKHNKRKRILLILIFLLLFIGTGITYATIILKQAKDILNHSYEEDGRHSGSEYRDNDVDLRVDNVSILFIGVDQGEARANTNGNINGLSDTLILTTLNKKDKSIKMLSIPRDSYVYVPEVERFTKINHAHSYGGAKATIETIENLFEIPVDYFIRLNFDAFIDIVDSLGGIEVYVPYELYEMDSNDTKDAIHLFPGEQWLNGEEALALARTRKKDNDIERGKRQQEIIKAIVDRAISFNTLLKFEDLMNAVGKNMTTNLTFSEITSFASFVVSSKLDIETLNLDGTDLWTDAYYYQLNDEDVIEKQSILQEHLGIQ